MEQWKVNNETKREEVEIPLNNNREELRKICLEEAHVEYKVKQENNRVESTKQKSIKFSCHQCDKYFVQQKTNCYSCKAV